MPGLLVFDEDLIVKHDPKVCGLGEREKETSFKMESGVRRGSPPVSPNQVNYIIQ